MFWYPGVDMEGNNSNFSLDYEYWTEETAQYEHFRFIVNAYVDGPLILAGLIGNIIAFCTLGKLTSQNAMTFHLRGLALSDICVLLCFMVYLCSWNVFHFHLSTAITKIALYAGTYSWPILQISNMINVWITVVVGMTRYIALCRPLDATSLCTKSRARKHMICIVLISLGYGLPAFLNDTINDGTTIYTWYYYIYMVGCNLIFRVLTPFSLLLFFSVRIIVALRTFRSRSQALERHGGQQVDATVTSMLLVLLGVFLVCNVLMWIGCIVFKLLARNSVSNTVYARRIIGFLHVLNSSVNCLIYVVYMKEFRRLLCVRWIHRSHQNEDYELS